jgi:hypothetical protein
VVNPVPYLPSAVLVAATFAGATLVLLIVAGVAGVAFGHGLRTWRTKKLKEKKAAEAAARKRASARPPKGGGASKAAATGTGGSRAAAKGPRPKTPPSGKVTKRK